MKSHPFPPTSHTMPSATNRVSLYAPCRNRTCNLMIKSHIRAASLARTDSRQSLLSAIEYVGLLPSGYPKPPRTSPLSHTVGSSPKSERLEGWQKQKYEGWTEKMARRVLALSTASSKAPATSRVGGVA